MTEPDPLRIRGGAGGIAARLDDLDQAGALLRRVAAALAGFSREVLSVAVDPGVQLTALLAPLTFGRAEAALGAATLGPGGLAALAARADVLGLTLAAAADGYRAADAAVAAGLRAAEVSAGRSLAAVGTAITPALVAGAAVGVIIVVMSRGDLRDSGRLPEGLRQLGGLTLRLLADHARLVELAVPVLPGLIGGAVEALPGGPLVTATASSPRGGPVTVADVATDLGLFGRLAGVAMGGGPWLQDFGEVQVRARPAHPGRAAADVGELVGRIPSSGSDAPRIHLQRVDDSVGARRWVVSVPGTVDWSPRAGRTPFDLTGDVRLLAGERTAAAAGVVEAMRAVGVRQGEPVLLVGHSQGGLIAATVAADPAVRREFAVTQVLTTGAPVASIPIPDDVHVLSIEHSDDLVPRLDGSANRDRPNWVTVSARAPIESLRSAQERSEPLVAHRLELYQRTAARIDSSIDPSIVNWRQGLSPFLYGPRSSGGAAWDVEVSRVGTS